MKKIAKLKISFCLFGVAYYIYDTYNEKKIEKQFK